MASMVANNAIGWAQFQLNGGWKNTLSVVIGYAVIISGIIVVTASIEPRQAGMIYSMWVKGLLGLQVAILAIYASNRIIGGIRRDLTAALIESHRLMPVPPLHVVVGYIFGAAGQAMSLMLANFIIGAVTTKSAGLPMAYWVKANLIVLTFTLFVWSVVAGAAMSARGAMFWVIGPIAGFWFSGGALSAILPAVAMLCTPLQGPSVFDARLTDRPPALYGVPMMCQAAIATICLIAATRKYRRSEDAALSPWLALALLAAVTATCVLGMRFYDEIRPRFVWESSRFTPQYITAAIVIMLVSAVAACSIAWGDALLQRAKVRGRRELPRGHVLPPILGVLLIAAIGAGLKFAAEWHLRDSESRRVLLYTAGILLAHAMAICYLARWMYVRVDRAIVVVVIWMMLLWLAPLIIDMIIRAMAEEELPMSTIAAWSPIGCLIALFDDDPSSNAANPLIGLMGQFAIGLVPVVMYYVEQLRMKRPVRPALNPT